MHLPDGLHGPLRTHRVRPDVRRRRRVGPLGFNLTVAKGQQEGKSFDFEQAETNIGRTSDNDIVLYDPGVSRKHARIFEKSGKYFAEDMGSANGTKVNGEPVKVARELKDGDSLAVGPVVFAFKQAAMDATLPPTGPSPDQSTRIIGMGQVAAPADDGATRIRTSPAAQKPPRRPDLEMEATGALPPIVDSDSEATVPPRPARMTGPRNAVKPAAALAKTDSEEEVPGDVVPATGSAAERLRRRRQYGDSLGGQLAYLWSDLPTGRKVTIISVLTVLTLGISAGLYFLFREQEVVKDLPPETASLGRVPVMYSFGYGDGVDYEHVDQKSFEFEFASATRAVAVLRFQAMNVSEKEVSIELNGSSQGTVPADKNDRDREVQQLLQVKDLKKGETNRVVFDNTKNPPGKETWQVSNLSVEVIPIPDGSDEDLNKIASDFAKKGREFLDNRDIGSENLFRSWKNYRSAWLTLEAIQGQKPELYVFVRDQLDQTSKELDSLCSKMMLDVQRSLQLKQEAAAVAKLEEIDTYFPTNEHRCHNQAHALRNKLEL